jgi:CheY-like chemotaxis protein/Tfp pilus assembly protein PilZ
MGKRILVVEGGMPVIPFDQSLLLRKEHEVSRASTGAEALEKVAAFQPNLIVLDDRLMDMEVSQVIRGIRELPQGRHASILLLGGEFGAKAPEGVNHALPKPVIGQDFNEACRRLLSIEARKEARLLVYVQVQGYLQSSLFLCNSLNLSASGILILTARKLRMGDTVQLQITLPREKEKVRVSGRIVREAGEVESRLNAYGVSFQDVSPEDRDRIRTFVEEEARRQRAGGAG